jgi:hypothetical protein
MSTREHASRLEQRTLTLSIGGRLSVHLPDGGSPLGIAPAGGPGSGLQRITQLHPQPKPQERIEEMKMMRVLTVVLLLAFSGAILGCGGGGADVKQMTTTTTLGQELQDLEDAYQKGLLSEEEYQKSRKNLMKKYDD